MTDQLQFKTFTIYTDNFDSCLMNPSQKSSYLLFTNIWNRQKDYDAHKRRLGNIKSNRCSPYNYQKHQEFFSEIATHNHSVNKKKDQVKKDNIQRDNSLILKRLVRVTNKIQTHCQIPNKRTQSHKKFLEQLYLEEENKRMKHRIGSAEAQLKNRGMEVDYKKHLYYKVRMQKFYADGSNTVKLKALENVKYFQDPNRKKSPQATSGNDRTVSHGDYTYLTSTPNLLGEHVDALTILENRGPTYMNNNLSPQREEGSSRRQNRQLHESLKKMGQFFRTKRMLSFDQQLRESRNILIAE